MHGFGGFKEQKHIELMAQSFYNSDYTTIRFDTTHTIGESEGNMEEANLTNYYEDLEDVIKWSKGQTWYQEPFCLAAHSLGGICIILYALKYFKEIKALAPISTVVSGKITLDDFKSEDTAEWEKTGWAIQESHSKLGVVKKMRWLQFKQDILQYDVLPQVGQLKIPILLITGENDQCLDSQKLLFDHLATQKELHIIKGAKHTIREEKQLKEFKDIFDKWIEKL